MRTTEPLATGREGGCVAESDLGPAQKDDGQPGEQNQGYQLDNGVALDAVQVSVHANASRYVALGSDSVSPGLIDALVRPRRDVSHQPDQRRLRQIVVSGNLSPSLPR